MKLTNHKIREIALQFLYSIEAGSLSLDCSIPLIMNLLEVSKKNVCVARDLAKEVLDNTEEIDQKIATLSEEYSLSRISFMERNILRLAIFEAYFKDLPLAISIAEAKRLCSKFSTPEASKFVHGIISEWEKTHDVAATV